MFRDLAVSNLQKEGQTIWCHNQIIILQSFYRKFISNRNKKTQILTKKSARLGISILELSKILMYEFCYGYAKPKYDEKVKLCYTDTDSFIVYYT